MRRRAFAALLLLAPLAWGQPPALEIPSEVRPAGQYCTLVPKTDAVSVSYVGLSGLDPVPSSLLKDARTFLLDTRGLAVGRYRFAAVGASKTGEQARADFDVVIGTPPPTPPGPTPPGPVPPGPLPDGAFGLMKASRDGFAAVVNPPAGAAARLAAAQRSHAAAVAAGAFSNPAAVLDGWRAANRAALTEAERATFAPWATAVKARVDALVGVGHLTTNQAWHDAFVEIADGLGAGRSK